MKKLLLVCSFAYLSLSGFAQYTTTNVITGLAYPTVFDIAPDGRYFITLKGGYNGVPEDDGAVVVYNANGTFQNTLWNFTDSTETYFERGILGIEVDPNFATNNYVYVFYNHLSPAQIRVVRFTETNGVGSNPVIILNITDPYSAGNHTGGNIHFGPDGKLYVSIGDRATQATAQNLSLPFGKYLRINADGTIPTDNPFYDDGITSVGNDDRIWSRGHRNSFDFCFSTINDSLYASENGLNTWDEVNMIHKGANYGWNTCEGFYLQGSTTNLCTNPSFTAPLDDWGAPLPAVTGIMIYDHALIPALQGHMLVADNDLGDITDFTLGNSPANDLVTARTTMPMNLTSLTDLELGPEGCVYSLEGGYTTNGKIKKTCPNGMGVSVVDPSQWIGIYPNPAETNAMLVFSENFIGGRYEVRDIEGRMIFNNTIATSQINVDLESVQSGMYFVKAIKETQTLVVKLVVN